MKIIAATYCFCSFVAFLMVFYQDIMVLSYPLQVFSPANSSETKSLRFT